MHFLVFSGIVCDFLCLWYFRDLWCFILFGVGIMQFLGILVLFCGACCVLGWVIVDFQGFWVFGFSALVW